MRGSKIILSYVPVIHSGYIELLKEADALFGVFGPSLLEEFPYLKRDVRALHPDVAALSLKAYATQESMPATVAVVSSEYLGYLRGTALEGRIRILMPGEDVSRQVAERYLAGVPVNYLPAFLRWDMSAVQNFKTPEHHREISTDRLPGNVVSLCESEAKKSPDWWRRLGAVCFRDGQVVLSAHNSHMPTEFSNHVDGDPRIIFDAGEEVETTKAIHAERALIAEAARRGITLEGTAILVSVFPCPTCAWMMARAGIRKLFYAEGYSRLDGDQVLSSYGVEVIHVRK